MEKYFSKFPTISYSNTICRDISRRVRLTDNIGQLHNIPTLFYPVEIKAGFRADSLADAYYSDSEFDWLIYLANDIIDPYFDWYLDENQFQEYINNKYGSQEAAIEEIKFYRNNWASNSEDEISPNVYNNHLPAHERKYYTPVYGQGAKVISYKRKPENWKTNTNKILEYDIVTYSTGNSFSNGEIVDIKHSGEIVGGATVIVSNSSSVIVQHVSGNTHANSTLTKTIIGETSNSHAVVNAVDILQENISNSEARFWSAVSAYDIERENNESKKHLNIVSSAVSLDIAETLRIKMKEE